MSEDISLKSSDNINIKEERNLSESLIELPEDNLASIDDNLKAEDANDIIDEYPISNKSNSSNKYCEIVTESDFISSEEEDGGFDVVNEEQFGLYQYIKEYLQSRIPSDDSDSGEDLSFEDHDTSNSSRYLTAADDSIYYSE